MSKFSPKIVPYSFKYGAMPLDKRKKILPERSVCSLYPSNDYADCVSKK